MLSNLCSGGEDGGNEVLYSAPGENNTNYTSDSFKNIKVKSNKFLFYIVVKSFNS